MNNRNTTLTGLAFCLLLAFILSSCNNTVIEPTQKKAAYSIYGVLRLKANTNYIRVKNLNVPLVLNSKHSLNATVHLKNLKTGHSQLLTEDSLLTFDGVTIHNLKVTTPIQPLTTYKVIVKSKSSGQKTTAKVKTPMPFSMSIRPRVDSCGTTRTIRFDNLTTGETMIAYAVAAKKIENKLPNPKNPDLGPKKRYYVRKNFAAFPGKLGSRTFDHEVKVHFPCKLASPEINMYAAVYGPGYSKNKQTVPDSVTNVDRFLESKLVAVVKDTVSFVALIPDSPPPSK